ncbi:MAG: hypothetical protein KDC38_20965, partial [Planctomycetes bacterium]|nr:hypothetical protein [Planctomycetota bacterium]
RAKSADVARMLIRAGARTEYRDPEGCSAAAHAARQGDALRAWIEVGLDLRADPALASTAIRAGNTEAVACLLEAGGGPRLHELSRFASRELEDLRSLVRLSMASGSDLEMRDTCARTPLHCAILDSNLALVRVLLEEGANWRAEHRRRNGLDLAVECEQRLGLPRGRAGSDPLRGEVRDHAASAIVEILRQFGASERVTSRPRNLDPLELAIRQLDRRRLEALIREGTDLEQPDVDADRPLHQLSRRVNRTAEAAELIELLLRAGADLESRQGSGATALMTAVCHGGTHQVATLLAHGADPHARDERGQSALDLMVRATGHEPIDPDRKIQLLLGAGIELDDVATLIVLTRLRYERALERWQRVRRPIHGPAAEAKGAWQRAVWILEEAMGAG